MFAHAVGYVDNDHYVDFVAQQAVSPHFVVDGDAVSETRTPFRHVWPSELDLMARLAGMALRHRWVDWDRTAFSGESTAHVSVWEAPVVGADLTGARVTGPLGDRAPSGMPAGSSRSGRAATARDTVWNDGRRTRCER